VVLMGVSGSGKTTIGLELAKIWAGSVFLDADDFHPAANVAKMRAGQPLNDTDRQPWLEALAVEMENRQNTSNMILACSALKFSYRETLRGRCPPNSICFVLLDVSYDVVSARLSARKGHFFNPILLQSQFQSLEPGRSQEHIISIETSLPPEVIAESIKREVLLRKQRLGSRL